jgi:trimethylguanosine synthase
MGKKLRQTKVSGLFQFLEASTPSAASAASTAGPSTLRQKRKLSLVDSETEPAPEKRRTGLLGPGNEAYDATGLVPFYTEATQVPAHLQKCRYLKAQELDRVQIPY